MRYNNTFYCLLFLIVAAFFFQSGCAPAVKQKKEDDVKKDIPNPEDDGKPKVTTSGPQPKLVMKQKEIKFGSMVVGETRKQTLIIKNEGKADLELHMGPASCGKCSKFELRESKVPPGGTTELLVTWFPFELDEAFRKYATLTTNAPDSHEVEIVVSGIVDKKLQLSGGTEWNLPVFKEGKPTVITRYLYSTILDKFEVTEIKAENPLITTKHEKMSPDQLKEFSAKVGFAIHVTVSPKIPIGGIAEQIVIKTDVPLDKESKEKSLFSVYVKGVRTGPIRFHAFPGISFYKDVMIVDLKKFEGSEGRTGQLQLFIEEPEGTHFKILDVSSSSPNLKVTFEEDKKFKAKNRRRFLLKLDVPAGTPSVDHTLKKMVNVVIKTNHPDAEEIRLRVSFLTL